MKKIYKKYVYCNIKSATAERKKNKDYQFWNLFIAHCNHNLHKLSSTVIQNDVLWNVAVEGILCWVVRVCGDYRWYEGARNVSRFMPEAHSLKLYHIEFTDAFLQWKLFYALLHIWGGIIKLVFFDLCKWNEWVRKNKKKNHFSSQFNVSVCVSKDLFMQISYFGIDKWWQIIEIYLRKWP